MFLIIKGRNTAFVNGELEMRLERGNEALERVNIAAKIDQSMPLLQSQEQSGIAVQVDQLTIFGIAKDALLAIRYRLDDGKARRVQFRLQSVEACRSVIEIFHCRGMHFQDHLSSARDNVSNASSLRMQSVGGTEARVPLLNDSGLVPMRQAVDHKRSYDAAAGRVEPFTPSDNPISKLGLSHHSYTRNTTAASSNNGSLARPLTSDSLCRNTPIGSNLPQPMIAPPSDLSVLRSGPAARPASVRLTNSDSSVVESFNTQQIQSYSSLDSHRPSTALRPLSTATPDTLEHEIPPRRELPFHRPSSQSRSSALPDSRPVSAAVSLPPLPGQKSDDRDARRSTASALRPLLPAVSQRKRNFENFESDARSSSMSNIMPKSAAVVGNQHTMSLSSTLAIASLALPEQQSAKQALGESTDLHGRGSISSLVKHNTHPVAESLALRRNGPDTGDRRNPVSASETIPKDNPNMLHDYSVLDHEERMAALDQFMMNHIEDPLFAQLCEDVESCWRRIALGL